MFYHHAKQLRVYMTQTISTIVDGGTMTNLLVSSI